MRTDRPGTVTDLRGTGIDHDNTHLGLLDRPSDDVAGDDVDRVALVMHEQGDLDFAAPNASFAAGVADRTPYDGITAGQLNLWAGLETGIDPRTLGGNETAAAALGFTPQRAMSLQAIAFQTITPLPEPQAWATLALGLGALGVFVRGRRRMDARPQRPPEAAPAP